jgi:hypothetical protein
MIWSMRCLLTGIMLTVFPSAILAQGNPYQGIYAGKMKIVVVELKRNDFFPARLTVMPDGHSILLTVQTPDGAPNWVIRGNFTGNLFVGASRGRFNATNYVYANNYQIRFVRDEARLTGGPVHPGPGIVPITIPLIFHRVRS